MLQLTIKDREWWNPSTEQFMFEKGETLNLEHSLLSISKWESKWKIPFIDEKRELTYEQFIDYVRCMTIGKVNNPNVYYNITTDDIIKIKEYMNDKMSATWFSTTVKKQGRKQVITSERIYAWMCEFRIPFECEKWHINRLMNLIEIRTIDKQPPAKKRKDKDIMADYAKLNEERRKRMNSTG